MRFEEAYGGWTQGRLTQEEAARLLGVCERTFRLNLDRFHEAGVDRLIDKRLSQVSHRRAPVHEVLCITERYRERHAVGMQSTFMPGTARMAGSAAIPG